jgi:acetyl-CoA acetyltransferase
VKYGLLITVQQLKRQKGTQAGQEGKVVTFCIAGEIQFAMVLEQPLTRDIFSSMMLSG